MSRAWNATGTNAGDDSHEIKIESYRLEGLRLPSGYMLRELTEDCDQNWITSKPDVLRGRSMKGGPRPNGKEATRVGILSAVLCV